MGDETDSRGQERLAEWTVRLQEAYGSWPATKKVIDAIGAESSRLKRESEAMAHLYYGLVNLTHLKGAGASQKEEEAGREEKP